MKAIRMLPSSVRFAYRMDIMDAKLFKFFAANWCPGQNIRGETNIWRLHFAPMVEYEGVQSAILSLAAIYLWDYVDDPSEVIGRRWITRYGMAEDRLKHLLNKEGPTDAETRELITTASILSIQDITFTERRHKPTNKPRWLTRFEQCEPFIKSLCGLPWWKTIDRHLPSLHISQIVVVGRGIILPQLMRRLPSDLDLEKETARFHWLLCGSEESVYEIHGGCGFSRMLLHYISQITFCAAWLHKKPESTVFFDVAKYLLRMLVEMKQWSSEHSSWEASKTLPQPIEWIRSTNQGYIVNTARAMTEATAEAWRIAAIIYLRCRVFGQFRSEDLEGNLSDLAHCIRIMPTSGYLFTSQAPLLPAFLLTMLGTRKHRIIAQAWFEGVSTTPVRSNVRPLYQTLIGIRSWICTIYHPKKQKRKWWERLVERLNNDEVEMLCLI
ncbi:fungal-specific transcription factor domain-containing protein [Trichoderma sp. SZMC 28013]